MIGLEGLAFAIVTSFLTVLIHYEALRMISGASEQGTFSPRRRMLMVIIGVVAAHMIEAGVFAVAFWVGAEMLKFGHFVGHVPTDAFQYYYFALETYTTQSVGDLYPVGGLRVLASLEPLVGLILIGWSTSLTFVLMRRYWRVTPVRSPRRG
ncbi:MAG: potassium transporter Kef [Phenylobacterium sp.]